MKLTKIQKRSVNSINKKQLKDSYRLLCCLDIKVLCCLGSLLLESIFIELESILLLENCLFQQDISRSRLISIWYMSIKTTTLVHNACPHVYHLLCTYLGVSLLHWLIVASLRINKIFINIDKVKIKPYLQQNHSTC